MPIGGDVSAVMPLSSRRGGLTRTNPRLAELLIELDELPMVL